MTIERSARLGVDPRALLGHPARAVRGICLDGPTDDLRTRVERVANALPDHCVIVGLTAARLHSLWLPPAGIDERIEIAHTATGRARRMSRSTRAGLIGSRREFTPADICEMDGLRVTSPARTWRDLGSRLSLAGLVAAGDSALRNGTSSSALADAVSRTRGQRGVFAARQALPLLDPRSRSRPESHMRVELSVPGWPQWQANKAVYDANGGWLAEPDLSNEQFRVAVEYQGAEHAQVPRMRRDLTRLASVSAESWQMLLVGPAEVFVHTDRLRLAVREMLIRSGWRTGHTR